MKQDILDKLNEFIVDEKGTAVTIDSMFVDSNLDSLGTMLTLLELDAEYSFLVDVPNDVDVVEHLSIQTLTVRELVNICKLSSTSTSTARKEEVTT